MWPGPTWRPWRDRAGSSTWGRGRRQASGSWPVSSWRRRAWPTWSRSSRRPGRGRSSGAPWILAGPRPSWAGRPRWISGRGWPGPWPGPGRAAPWRLTPSACWPEGGPGEPPGPSAGQGVLGPGGGPLRQLGGGAWGGGGPPGPQRGGEDDHLLHDPGPGPARCGDGLLGRPRYLEGARLPAGPPGAGVPGPGALHLPAADGGGEPAADPGAAPFEPGGARGPGGSALGGVRPGGPAATAGRPALGRRKAPLRGGPGGGRGAPVPALGRALCGGGPHRGGRAPGADPLPYPAGDRRSHHRPQRPGDPDHHPPGLHHAPGARPGGGHRGGAPGEPRSPPVLLGGAVPPVKRLDRYILKELAGSVLFGFGAFTSLFLAAEMVNLASLAADLKAPVGALVRAFL